MNAATNAVAAWIACLGLGMRQLQFLPVQEGNLYGDDVIRVTAFRTKHIHYSYAYLVKAEGKRVLFGGDMCHKGPQEDFPISVLDEPIDLAICESSHYSPEAYIPIFKNRSNLKRLCFNHYVEMNIGRIQDLKTELPGVEILRAQDGMEIAL